MIASREVENLSITRAEGEDAVITGSVPLFTEQLLYEYGGRKYYEVFERNAFEGVSLNNIDFCINHDLNLIIANTDKKTLSVNLTSTGFDFEAKVVRNTAGEDLLKGIDAGLYRGVSFRMSIKETDVERENKKVVETIKRVDRWQDVSPCVRPAYKGTSLMKGDVLRKEVEARFGAIEGETEGSVEDASKQLAEQRKRSIFQSLLTN